MPTNAVVSSGKIWIFCHIAYRSQPSNYWTFRFSPLLLGQIRKEPIFQLFANRHTEKIREYPAVQSATNIMTLQLQIEKLKGLDNYKAWAMTVRAYLETEDLWTVVETGPDGSDESLQKDRRAKFIILCLIETKLCQFMASIRTAKDLWLYLKKQHSLR